MANEIKLDVACQKTFGISPRRYRDLSKEQGAPPVVKGYIDLLAACKWLIEYYRKFAEQSGYTSLAEERLRYQRARAHREELLAQEMDGKLIRIEQVQEDLMLLLSNLKQSLMNWVKRLPPVLKSKEEKDMMLILQSEIHQLLDELSKGSKKICKTPKKR